MADFSAALRKLEFDKILERIRQLAVSDPARDVVGSIVPSTNKEWIQAELDLVSEAKSLLVSEGIVPLDGIKRILPAIRKSAIENHFLSPRELLDIASTLRASRVLSGFISKRRSACRGLEKIAAGLYHDKVLEFNIFECIDEEGRVKDRASKELARIRQEMISAAESLRKRLEGILRRVSEKELVQEEIITTRDGRMVIPIKAEHKNHVPGFIHSSSSSGATVFIEPAETLDLNNGLRELQLAEQREVSKILTELTSQVSEAREKLEQTCGLLGSLDILFAKAKYSIEILGNPPQVLDARKVRLLQARHPVLLQRHSRDDVIPLDLELGGDALTLIITGPNAGGKSVAMKTVGLLCLCMQAGIHLPAAPESELCVLDNIFADIGDDQSIEDDLSTFSSHLHGVRRILAEASSQSLVLIDEIGAGTDPAEGGALAASILRDLTDRGTLTIATTHHGMLKAFAHESPGIVNGSMEFDQDDLRPTYKFRMGVPGSSYALELARRLGLPSSITDRARELVGDDRVKLDHLLSDLERQSQSYREQIKEVSQERDRLNKLVEVYDQKIKDLRMELRDIKRKAVSEAEEIVKGAHSLIERSVKEIRESAAEKAKVKIARENVQRLAEDVAALKSEEKHDELSNFVVGDTVRLRGGSETGEIVALKESMATVLWGDGKLRVNIQDLKKERRQKTSSSDKGHQLYLIEAKNEIDVRGLMGDEAIPIIQNFLDNAVAAGLHRVDIIHGKGTGALRKKVTGFLKTYVRLKSFRLGEWNEGGAGVTVVELAD